MQLFHYHSAQPIKQTLFMASGLCHIRCSRKDIERSEDRSITRSGRGRSGRHQSKLRSSRREFRHVDHSSKSGALDQRHATGALDHRGLAVGVDRPCHLRPGALGSLAGVDLLGWVVNASVWIDPGLALSPISKNLCATGRRRCLGRHLCGIAGGAERRPRPRSIWM